MWAFTRPWQNFVHQSQRCRGFQLEVKFSNRAQSKACELPFWQLALFAAIATALLFAAQYDKTLSLWDEGFLWYGAQRTALGEVPVRDFMSYDPGRYYLTAAFLAVAGDNGIVAVRGMLAFVQAAGFLAALCILARASDSRPGAFMLLAAAVVLFWMIPRHKMFDVSLSILLIAALASLIENSTKSRCFAGGVVVGLAAAFGRNHGLYGAIGFTVTLIWLAYSERDIPTGVRRMFLWGLGVVSGYMPILLMCIFLPGFASAFWESIRFYFEIGATNLPLPVPWPWRANFDAANVMVPIHQVLVGVAYVGLLGFSTVAPVWLFLSRKTRGSVSPQLIAASFLALPYAHFAFSRAGPSHLAQGVFPLLLTILIMLMRVRPAIQWPAGGALAVASFLITSDLHPAWQCRPGSSCEWMDINGNRILVNPASATSVRILRELANKYAPDGESFLAVPVLPGAYALLERKAPVWEIYALFPRPESFELREIERLKEADPKFVLLLDAAVDGREELRFRNIHPIMYKYIEENFDLMRSPYPKYFVYVRRR